MENLNSLSRRGLLQMAGGALVVRFALGQTNNQTSAPAAGVASTTHDKTMVDSFIAIHSDGSVTVSTSKVDVGTGLVTAFRQLVAEELDIPIERVSVIQGDTSRVPDHGGTGASSGIAQGGKDIRLAAATARAALLDLASKQLNRSPQELRISAGEIIAVNGSKVTIASLIGDKQFGLKVDRSAPLKNPSAYTVVGKSIMRTDVPGKCTGKHPYLHDYSVPGMLHGRVVRPPAIGSKLLSVDEASLRGIPDVRVVRIENFLAVVAKDEWAAVKAARVLKATWSDWKGLPGSEGLGAYVRNGEVGQDRKVALQGDVDAALAAAPSALSSTYYWPFQSHASLGPSCAIADCKESGTTIWSATQGVFGLRNNLARVFGIPVEKMRVIYMDGSGSYGGNGADDASAEALLLSRAVGQPVRLQWMREDEHGWDPKGPAQLHEMRGAVDSSGDIVAWETLMWIPDGPTGPRALLGPEAAGMKQNHGQGTGTTTLNLTPPYEVANLRVLSHHLKDTPLRLSNLRAPGKPANVLAVEGFADELAHQSGLDSLAFRLRLLKDPRAIEVLKQTAARMDWQTRPSPNRYAAEGDLLAGRGIAYMHYKDSETHLALGMTIAVHKPSGRITVRRIVCAHDCGLIVNPDGIRNQIEGNILQTLSRSLHEEVIFDESRVTSTNWASYPNLTFPEVPVVEVVLIDRPDQPSWGGSEAATGPVAAALANAFFDATGVRIRTVPFTQARVRTVLAKA
ncbi:MAG TPA: molybdopterin cofactor-binding domain-containing protein [Bryobacteraceae bacterium]|nr:molybdopterin cofactor-binding domain-containing protein [Bryobacteraceae bacterium]